MLPSHKNLVVSDDASFNLHASRAPLKLLATVSENTSVSKSSPSVQLNMSIWPDVLVKKISIASCDMDQASSIRTRNYSRTDVKVGKNQSEMTCNRSSPSERAMSRGRASLSGP